MNIIVNESYLETDQAADQIAVFSQLVNVILAKKHYKIKSKGSRIPHHQV